MPQNLIRRYLRHGTLSQLFVFEAVARLGNFTRASEELYMAQPTVSVQIKKLSEAIGLTLFEQVGRKVHLTDAGRMLYEACQSLFATLHQVEAAFGDLRGLRAGRLQIAVSTTAKFLAPRLLAAFAQQHPGIDVALQIHNRRGLLDRFNANLDDLYLFANPPQKSDIVIQNILPNPLVAFARADHPLAQEKRITFERLAQEPFLMREPGSGTRMAVFKLFEQNGFNPQTRMELSDNEAIKEGILAGLGVSIMARHTYGIGAEPKELAVLDVEGMPVEAHWYFVYPLGKQPSTVARCFMDFAREHAPQLLPGAPALNAEVYELKHSRTRAVHAAL